MNAAHHLSSRRPAAVRANSRPSSRRVSATPRSPAEWIGLQRTIGNQATVKALAKFVQRDLDDNEIDALKAYLQTKLGVGALSTEWGQKLQMLVKKYKPGELDKAKQHADRIFALLAPQAAAPRLVQVGSLVTAWKLNSVASMKGEVTMGQAISATGADRTMLWTAGVAGCVGVALVSKSRCLIAHWDPSQFKPGELQGTISSLPFASGAGVTAYMTCPSGNTPYVQAVRAELQAKGYAVQPLLQSSSIAVHLQTQEVAHGFNGDEVKNNNSDDWVAQ